MPRPLLRSIAARDITGEPADIPRLSATRVQRTLRRILQKNRLCAIATVSAGQEAHVNTAYFAFSGSLELYFLSHPESIHCRNLRARPTMAMAVYESRQTWGALDRGVQLFGTCREVRGTAAHNAARAYGSRFEAYSQWIEELDEDDPAGEYRFYRFVPSRVKVFDEREFGGAIFVTARVTRPSLPRRRPRSRRAR